MGTATSPTMWPSVRQRPTRAPSRWIAGPRVGARLGWWVSRGSGGIVPPTVAEPSPGRRSLRGGLRALLVAVRLRFFAFGACDLGELLFTATGRGAALDPYLRPADGLLGFSPWSVRIHYVASGSDRRPRPGALLAAGTSANRLRYGTVVGRRVGGMAAVPRLVLVEVEQVAAAVGEDRVDAAVVPAPGLGDEHHPLGLEPPGVALAVVGAQPQAAGSAVALTPAAAVFRR